MVDDVFSLSPPPSFHHCVMTNLNSQEVTAGLKTLRRGAGVLTEDAN